ncbi:MAG: putative glycosyltransferase [Parcubacteria group bacterium Gr01-1014_20]|nr:MAG: putative glycosyltransferase [Parcubacteria group bacterium Gr01-1014_20]
MAKPFLSIILPITEKSNRLPLVLLDLDRNLSKAEYSSEILAINLTGDHDVSEVVRKIGETVKNLKIIDSEVGAFGSAIKRGMLLTSGNIRLLALSGRSIPVDQLNTMIPHFKNGADLVVARRNFEGEKRNYRKLARRIAVEKAAGLVMKFFLRDIKDPFSDFLAFTEIAAEKIFTDLKPIKHFINLSILLAAKKNSFNVKEVSVYVS